MTVRVCDEVDEKFVSGEWNSAAVYPGHLCVGIGGMPDIEIGFARAQDLLDVLGAALRLAFPAYVLTAKGEAALD